MLNNNPNNHQPNAEEPKTPQHLIQTEAPSEPPALVRRPAGSRVNHDENPPALAFDSSDDSKSEQSEDDDDQWLNPVQVPVGCNAGSMYGGKKRPRDDNDDDHDNNRPKLMPRALDFSDC